MGEGRKAGTVVECCGVSAGWELKSWAQGLSSWFAVGESAGLPVRWQPCCLMRSGAIAELSKKMELAEMRQAWHEINAKGLAG